MTFGSSVEKVKRQAEQFLAKDYGCNHKIIRQLIQQAKVEHLSPWCSSTEKQTRPK